MPTSISGGYRFGFQAASISPRMHGRAVNEVCDQPRLVETQQR